jgi:hypothetical protein
MLMTFWLQEHMFGYCFPSYDANGFCFEGFGGVSILFKNSSAQGVIWHAFEIVQIYF